MPTLSTSRESSDAPAYRLVVSDMDGTLLNEKKEIPQSFWPLVEQLLDRGVVFAPASGRQYATLARQFAPIANRIPIIAENGNYVANCGEVVSITSIDHAHVTAFLAKIRAFNESRGQQGKLPLGFIVCGKESAYVENFPATLRIPEAYEKEMLAEAKRYYFDLQLVDDLEAAAAKDDVIKFALFDPYSVEEESAPYLRSASPDLQPVISGQHWLDVIDAHTNKGTALAALQQALGISKAETICFVDYFNDAEMIDHCGRSFAMDNAHPEIKRRTTDTAPSNADEGVITTLREVFAL